MFMVKGAWVGAELFKLHGRDKGERMIKSLLVTGRLTSAMRLRQELVVKQFSEVVAKQANKEIKQA